MKTDLNIDVSERRLYSILRTNPIFLIHQRKRRNFPRRSLDINNYGELVQGDIAVMFEYESYKYFLLVVDTYSTKVFVRPLKNKSSALTSKALRDIFTEFNSKIYVFETDRGKVKKYEIYYIVNWNSDKLN